MSTLRKVGRPVGSGAQLAPVERVRKHRTTRAASGAVRVDFSLNPDSAAKLGQLIELWHCSNRKEAIQQAIQIAYISAYGENERKG